ncbi:hypothetical protein [Streptacidiphilus anmyonensis]|nr:hypothetical protein [Streptacidiphilus anmyonensis]
MRLTELMRLTEDLEKATAAAVASRVYNGGLKAGRAWDPPSDFDE